MSQTVEAPVQGAIEPYRPMVSGAPLLPQVNLLPPAVRERRALQRLKLVLLGGVGASVLVAGGLWFYATSELDSAVEARDSAQLQSTALLREQTTYAAVPEVKAKLADAESARALITANETLWKPQTDAILWTLPPGALVTNIVVESAGPMNGAPAAPDALQTQGFAGIVVAIESPTVIDTSAWLTNLSAVPGFLGATLDTASLTEDDNQVPVYEVTAHVQVDPSVHAGRFAEAEEGGE
jgi:Tfp pilus assembly protein PilN